LLASDALSITLRSSFFCKDTTFISLFTIYSIKKY
jgi:hypothetical protein